MKSTKEQLLRDPEIEPSNEVIAQALGESYHAYVKFISELANHNINLEYRYYTDGKAWLGKGLYKWTGLRGGQNEKTVFWFSIWDGFFKVSFFIPEKARKDALNLPLDNKVIQMIEKSPQMGKIKFFWIAFDLYSDEIFESVFLLADFRRSIK